MRILLAHNAYRQKGGEERAVEELRSALTERGHTVGLFQRSSQDWDQLSVGQKAGRALQIPYSFSARRALSDEIASFAPDVLHAHNIFPFLSSSIYDAAREKNIPVVQTLHNFRFFCMNGLLFRDGHPCELCVTGGAWHGAVHACYQDSRLGSVLMATTLTANGVLGTFPKKIDAFISLSQFSRELYQKAGFPADKMTVLPNAIAMESRPVGAPADSLLFLGRLGPGKGIHTLLEAFRLFSKQHPNVSLNVAGTGPLEEELKRFMKDHPSLPIRSLGFVSGSEKDKWLKEAMAVVFPSECYENCPYGVLESLARGVPVIGSRRGAIPELISHGKNGWLFEAESPESLAQCMETAVRQPDNERKGMREATWEDANARFSIEPWIKKIENLYEAL